MTQSLLQQVQSANKDELKLAAKELAKHLKENSLELNSINSELSDEQTLAVTHQLAIQFANEDLNQSIELIRDSLDKVEDPNSEMALDLKNYLGTIFIYTKRLPEAEEVYEQIFAATEPKEIDLSFLFNKWTTQLKYKDQDEVLWQPWQAILDEKIEFDTNSAKDLAMKIFALYKGKAEELHRDHRRFSDHMFMHQNATKFTHLINYLAELDI